MRKTKLSKAKNMNKISKTLLPIIALILLVSFAFARDARYESDWTEIDNGSGDINAIYWNYFYTWLPHSMHSFVQFENNFASVMQQSVGFENFFFRIKVYNQSCGASTATMKVFSKPESGNIGCKLVITFDGATKMNLVLSKLDDTSQQSASIDNYLTDFPAIECRMSISKTNTSGAFQGILDKININSGQVTKLATVYGSGSFTSENKFCHSLDFTFDLYHMYVYWDCYAEIRDIGVRPDVKNEDAQCDIRDVTLIARLYGSDVANIGYDAWFAGDYYKADCTADFKVDLLDYYYIMQHYGEVY